MSYGWNAYMKPFRMRMTHNLICSYKMLDKMTVLVCDLSWRVCYIC